MVSYSSIKKRFRKTRDNLSIVLVKPKDYNRASIDVVKHLTNDLKMPGVYLSLNKPFTILDENFKKEGVRTELMIFIDAITSLSDGNQEWNEHCYYLDSPEHLSDISIAISQAVEAIEHKEKFIFIDSLSTLLVYNDADTVIKFIHFLVGKMRSWGVVGIIFSLKKRGEAGLIAELSQFVDSTIEL